MNQVKCLMIPTSNAGVAYYRMWNWANAALRNKAGFFHMLWWDKAATETHQWEAYIEDPMYKHRICRELQEKVDQADVVVIQMLHFQSGLHLLEALKQRFPNKPIVCENDDQMLSTPTYNPADDSYKPGSSFRNIAIRQMELSDAMIVSTPYLKEVYSEYCKNIYVMPNSLDVRVWDNLRHRKNKDIIRIGWAGGASHNEDLRIIEPVVHKVLEKHPTVKFNFIHGIPEFLKNIDRVEAIQQWTRIDRYPQFLASRSWDIALAPLLDNSFNRGKSNLRWLEAAGLCVPTIASNVGNFSETISNAEDGLLCETETDWLDAIGWTVSDEVARRKMGKNANKKVRKEFNIDINVFLYAKAMREIADRGQTVRIQDDIELQEASA